MCIILRRVSSFRGILVYIKVIIIKNTVNKSKNTGIIYILQFLYSIHTLCIHLIYKITWRYLALLILQEDYTIYSKYAILLKYT